MQRREERRDSRQVMVPPVPAGIAKDRTNAKLILASGHDWRGLKSVARGAHHPHAGEDVLVTSIAIVGTHPDHRALFFFDELQLESNSNGLGDREDIAFIDTRNRANQPLEHTLPGGGWERWHS